MTKLTHFTASGDVHMVNVGDKTITFREAVAEGWISMQKETLALIVNGGHKKGDVLGIARIAGIMAAKKTADLIPLCHPLMLSKVNIDLKPDSEHARVYCRSVVACSGQTGVEMEALHASQIALLTIYDMCKAVDKGMTIESVRLVEKQGGKSGHWKRS